MTHPISLEKPIMKPTTTLKNQPSSIVEYARSFLPWADLPLHIPNQTGFGILNFLQRHLHRLLLMTFVMNVADGLMTILWVSSQLAIEANPMMDVLLQIHPGLFLLGKVGLVTGGLLILAQRRNQVAAVLGIILVFIVYSLIIAYHMLALSLLILAEFL